MERIEVFQYKYTITIPRDKFLKYVVTNEALDADSLRVCCLLLTELNGWDAARKETRVAAVDPENFKVINVKKIADTLHLKKKEVKEALDILLRDGIIERGENRTSETGYRFTF